MKVVIEINGTAMESVDMEKHNRVKVQEAAIYLKEKYQEHRKGNQWAVYEIVESKVAGQIRRMDVLQQRRNYYDNKHFNEKTKKMDMPDKPKAPINRSGFDKYSNTQFNQAS